jgi:ABC-2 type transport system ATP-binding protein
VSQRRTIEAQLLEADSVPIAAGLIRKALEPDAEVTESPTEALVRFRTALTEADLGKLLAGLVEARIPVTQFRELQTDLEEAFMTFANLNPTASNGRAAQASVGAAHG